MGKKHGTGTYFHYLRNGAPKEASRPSLEQRLELRAFLGEAVDAYRKELQERCTSRTTLASELGFRV